MVDNKSLGVITNLGIGAVIFFTVLFLFDLLRYLLPGVYYYREAAARDPQWNNYDGTPLFALPRPSHRPLAWIARTIAYSEADTVRTHGLDVAMYLRFLATQIKVFAVLTLFTAVVLYPTYITAENKDLPEGDPLRAVGIEIASLANVPDKSHRLWVTLFSEIVVVGVICLFLYRDIHQYAAYRRSYRAEGTTNPSNYAIIVLDIPDDCRTMPAIFGLFDKIFPGAVAAVHPVRDAKKLNALKGKYITAVTKRERAEWDVAHGKTQQAVKLSETEQSDVDNDDPEAVDTSDFGETDAVNYWTKEQMKLKKEIDEKEDFIDDIAPNTHAAIVVFTSKRAATFAATAPFSQFAGDWKISRAAEPRGVNWARIDISKWTTRIRMYSSFAALTALAIFWTIPSSFIQALGNFSAFAEKYPNSFLADLEENHAGFVDFLEGILPPLLLFVVLLLVPILMRLIISFERIASRTLVEAKIRNFLFLFYTMSNFIYVVVIGSVFKKFKEVIDNPTTIVSLLSSSVPAQATFLMKYVLINAFLGSTLGMLNIGRLLIRPLTMRNARTTRELRKGDGIFAQYPFGKLYAICAMISLISFVYSTISPIICVVACLYFCIAYLCTKHLLLYGHRPLFEGGGYLFRDAWTSLLVGLYVHELSMIGIFSLKRAAPQAILTTLTFIFTIWFTLYCRGKYLIRAKHGSLMDQANADEEQSLQDHIPDRFSDMYIHPGLKCLRELEDIGKDAGDEAQVETTPFEEIQEVSPFEKSESTQ